jgi:hypothetical protein
MRLREKNPRLPVSETHPKALLKALNLTWRQIISRFKLDGPEPATEHERDAVLGAVVAREGYLQRWTNDLAHDRYENELDPKKMWFGPIEYWWPHQN